MLKRLLGVLEFGKYLTPILDGILTNALTAPAGIRTAEAAAIQAALAATAGDFEGAANAAIAIHNEWLIGKIDTEL